MDKTNQIILLLQEEKNELLETIRKAKMFLEQAPEGSLRLMKHGNGIQFFHRENTKDKKGVYIKKTELSKAYALAQKKYYQQVLREAEPQVRLIENFLNQYDPDVLERVFLETKEERKKLIIPVRTPDEIFAKEWQDVVYPKKEFADGMPEHFTQNDERVRSKSEVLIANALKDAGIPYRYEYPLQLGSVLIHPDFTILRMSDRREVYWEHFGLLDDSEYRNEALTRIDLYEKYGIFSGDRLIITAESYKRPLNLTVVKRKIHAFLDNSEIVVGEKRAL